jgi:hypothetical protein
MNLFDYLVPAAVAAVFVVLLLGLANMMRGGSANTSQKLMRWRVILQRHHHHHGGHLVEIRVFLSGPGSLRPTPTVTTGLVPVIHEYRRAIYTKHNLAHS